MFTVASVLCALSPSLPWLVAARFLQGLGAAAILALGMALLRLVAPQHQLGAQARRRQHGAERRGPGVTGGRRGSADHRAGDRRRPARRGGPRPDHIGSSGEAQRDALDPARPAACQLLPHVGDRLDVLLCRRHHGLVRAAVSSAARPWPGHADDRALHDRMAVDRGHRGPSPLAGRLANRVATGRVCAAGGVGLAVGLAAAALWPLEGDLLPLVPLTMLCGLGSASFRFRTTATCSFRQRPKEAAQQGACRPAPDWRARPQVASP